MTWRARAAVLAVLLPATGACRSVAVDPATLEDARTAVRVKTAIVNDPDIGVHPIEVRVTSGVVRLTGRVPTPAAAERAVAIARAVPGVADVRSEIRVGGAPPAAARAPDRFEGPPGALDEALGGARERRLLAAGASFTISHTRVAELSRHLKVGPIVRLGSGRGLGVAIGFGWYAADLAAAADPATVLGRVRVRPVMGGVGYTMRDGPVAVTAALVGGVAFNSIARGRRLDADALLIEVDNSAAIRPGVSVWVDVNGRIAVQTAAHYLITRPMAALVEDGALRERRLHGDALMVSAGIAYKIF